MRIYSHVPEKLINKGIVFELDVFVSAINDVPNDGRKYRTIHVLSNKLRGKNDAHGRPYQPSKWVFIEKKN